MADESPSPSINGTVLKPRPNRRQNDTLRGGRKHLTETEIGNLIVVARKQNRHGHRDATAIMIAFRHGMRARELCDLQWTQIDFQRGTIQVHRRKNGTPSLHYVNGTELRALRRLRRENEASCEGARNLSVSGLYRRRLLDAGGLSPTTSIGPLWSARHCGQRWSQAGFPRGYTAVEPDALDPAARQDDYREGSPAARRRS